MRDFLAFLEDKKLVGPTLGRSDTELRQRYEDSPLNQRSLNSGKNKDHYAAVGGRSRLEKKLKGRKFRHHLNYYRANTYEPN